MTALRQAMITALQVRRFAPKTQKAYLNAAEGLSKYYNQSPGKLNSHQVQLYLVYLTETRRLSWSTCNVVISGINFFYSHILNRNSDTLYIPCKKHKHKIIEVLSQKEVQSLITAPLKPKHRVMLLTTYSAGLRVSEVVNLKISDIDSQRMMIRIEQGKGNKDRYTILSEWLLPELRTYWRMYRLKTWLFPGTDQTRSMNIGSAQRIYYQAKAKAGITKGRGIHTLRHCFATHLIEGGVDIKTIRSLLGHRYLSTTAGYLKVTNKMLRSVKSPLDTLDLSNPEGR